jgi:hypothetical protein
MSDNPDVHLWPEADWQVRRVRGRKPAVRSAFGDWLVSTHLGRQIADRAIPEPDIQYHLGAATSQSLAGIADTARFRRSESLAQLPKLDAR